MKRLSKRDAQLQENLDWRHQENHRWYDWELDVSGLAQYMRPVTLNDQDFDYELGGSAFKVSSIKPISPFYHSHNSLFFETVRSIQKEKPGVISEEACWVAEGGGHLYIADTRPQLFNLIVQEFMLDKHLGM
jgi:hypothetical protein